jgi:hypothetical protein
MIAVPIAIFAFNRLGLLKKTLAALERCEGFPGGPLHVFSEASRDGLPAEAAAVNELRAWLRPWCARHHAILHEAATNRGLRVSIVSGVTALLQEHERVIVLEDDIVVSPVFIRFMHGALEVFRDRNDICQVSGYFVPHRMNLPPAGMLRVPACWGWATWRRSWQHYSDDAAALLAAIKARDVDAFDLNGSYANLEALENNAQGSLNTWFIRWYASVFLRGGLTVYPGQSLTRNIGFGGGGTHCGKGIMDNTYLRQMMDQGPLRVDWESFGGGEDPRFLRVLEDFYHWQNEQWVRPSWRQVWRSRWRRLTGRQGKEGVRAR